MLRETYADLHSAADVKIENLSGSGKNFCSRTQRDILSLQLKGQSGHRIPQLSIKTRFSKAAFTAPMTLSSTVMSVNPSLL